MKKKNLNFRFILKKKKKKNTFESSTFNKQKSLKNN